MPPKTMPMSAQPAPLQDSLGMNPEYLLPHQREQFRRHLQAVTDYQGQKSKEPNNRPPDAAIAEARQHLNALAQAAQSHEKLYPTPELFAQYANQYRQNLMQRQAQITNTPSNSAISKEDIRIITAKNNQLAARVKEIEAVVSNPGIPEMEKQKLRA